LPLEWDTAAVIWGEPGNNAQHSFFQLLHQGTPRAALDFLLPAKSSAGNQDQQNLAIANCLAQAEAFMAGNPAAAVRAELERQGIPAERVEYLIPHKVHAGDRPVTIVTFQQLDPVTLGRLVALYEHKVFTQSVIWGINAFDQWGVELGKKLAEQLAPAVRDLGSGHASASVTRLLQQLDRWRRT
jgi:glucose-6-phosphate isomerase